MAAMPRCTGGTQPAFGIEEEDASRDDLLPCSQPFQDLHTISNMCTDLDLTRFELAIGAPDENVLGYSGINDRIAPNGDYVTGGSGNLCTAVHARTQRPPMLGTVMRTLTDRVRSVSVG